MIKTILLYALLVILYTNASKEKTELEFSLLTENEENGELNDVSQTINEKNGDLNNEYQDNGQINGAKEICVYIPQTGQNENCVICMCEFSTDDPRCAILLRKDNNTLKDRLLHLKHGDWWHKDCLNAARKMSNKCPFCRGDLSYKMPNQEEFKRLFADFENNPHVHNEENLEKIECLCEKKDWSLSGLVLATELVQFNQLVVDWQTVAMLSFWSWILMVISCHFIPGWLRPDYGYISTMILFLLSNNNLNRKYCFGIIVLFIINVILASTQERFSLVGPRYPLMHLSMYTNWGCVRDSYLAGGEEFVPFDFFWQQIPKTLNYSDVWGEYKNHQTAVVSISMKYPIAMMFIQTLIKSVVRTYMPDAPDWSRRYRRLSIIPALLCQILPALAPEILFYPLFLLSFFMWNPEEIWFVFGANVMASYRNFSDLDTYSMPVMLIVGCTCAKIIIALLLHKYGWSIPMLK